MLNFQNAEILSYNHHPQFLGDNLRYKITKDITINGYIPNYSNLSGISGVYSGINSFLNGATDYDHIFVNNVDFGQGKITDISFDNNPTNDVKYKKYRASFTVYDSGNLFNVFSGYYSGLTWNNAQILDNFSENFTYNLNEDGTYSYDQSINLRFNSGQDLPLTPIQMGRVFASGFFAACNLTGFLGTNYNNNFNTFYTEGINLIDNSLSFKQHVDLLSLTGTYTTKYTHKFSINENGIMSCTEDGEIKGLYQPLMQSVQSGIAAELPQTFARASGIFATYGVFSTNPINVNPTDKNIIINKFEGIANYSINYSNDPRYQNVYIWDYTTTIDRSENRVYSLTEAGKVIGIGRPLLDKYPNAQTGYSVVKTGISARLNLIYSGLNPYPLILNQVAATEARAIHEGTIGYSQTYTDDITLYPTSGIKKYEFVITDKAPVQATNKFNILNFKEIIQPTNQSTLGQRGISIKMIGARGTALPVYLNYISSSIQPYKNLGSDFWLAACTYQFAPLENTLGMNLSYNYDGVYKNFTDIFYNIITNITGNF